MKQEKLQLKGINHLNIIFSDNGVYLDLERGDGQGVLIKINDQTLHTLEDTFMLEDVDV